MGLNCYFIPPASQISCPCFTTFSYARMASAKRPRLRRAKKFIAGAAHCSTFTITGELTPLQRLQRDGCRLVVQPKFKGIIFRQSKLLPGIAACLIYSTLSNIEGGRGSACKCRIDDPSFNPQHVCISFLQTCPRTMSSSASRPGTSGPRLSSSLASGGWAWL